MKVTETKLSGLLIIEPEIFTDNRSYFYQVFQQQQYSKYGIPLFVQDNVSRSKRNVIRGLHYQLPHAQGKLVWVLRGTVWDVSVDVRINSKTFAQWFAIELNDRTCTQLYIPPGFAHGFCVLSDEADFYYKCTDYYSPKDEHGIAYNDKELNIPWPITDAILSPKDLSHPKLKEITHDRLFT